MSVVVVTPIKNRRGVVALPAVEYKETRHAKHNRFSSHRKTLTRAEAARQAQTMLRTIELVWGYRRDAFEEELLHAVHLALGRLWEHWDVEGRL
jgi:hypothetical protein